MPTRDSGRCFLGDYLNDEAQFRGLMDGGIEYAKELNLRPGVALTAEQMAALTKDMVWLVAQEVTLADGSVQKVLAPQVYVASHDRNITGAGAVISGRDVTVHSTGDLTNTGSIAARNTAQLVSDNINNLGGRIHGNTVLANATTDINNIGGAITAGSKLIATAGRDINVETTTRSASSSAGGNEFGRTTIDRIGSLSVTGTEGTLVANAGRDINLVAAAIDNASKDGDTLLNAERNLNLATVTTASSNSITWDPVRYRKESSSAEVGTAIRGAGAITFTAGADINLRAANVDAGKELKAAAGNNLNILAGVDTAKFDETSQTTNTGFLRRETITTRNTLDSTNAIGSVLGGATVDFLAGHDLKVVGSSVVGDKDVKLAATNREFYWLVKGDNLRPDNPTSQELAVYNERERQRMLSGLKTFATGAIPAVMTGATGTILANRSTLGVVTSRTAGNLAKDGPALPNFETTTRSAPVATTVRENGTGKVTFDGRAPAIERSEFSPEVVNFRSSENYALYGTNPLRGTMSTLEARQWYLAQDATIPNSINPTASLESQARSAFDLRNANRTDARELMTDRVTADRLTREERNMTWDAMIKSRIDKGLSGDDIYRSIISSSQKTRTSVNKQLGLE